MKFTYTIKMRAMLSAILGIACFASASAIADSCESYWTAEYKCMQGCGPCAGSSSGSGNSSPSYDYGAAQRAQQAAADAEAERQRQAQAERIERERKAEEKRQKDAAFIRDRDAAANSLKGSSGSAMSQLKGLTGADSSGLKGSGFDTGNAGLKGLQGSNSVVDDLNEPAGLGGKSSFKGAITKPSKPTPHTDTSVVDARVPRDGAYLTDQVPELKNSPAADRITKGFQAVINHDWPVALAWWQDALKRDPNNAALKRSVALAQWMVDRPKTKAAKPVTPLGAAIYSASHGDSAKAIGQFEQIKKENPDIAPQIDDMIGALQKRQAKDAKASYWNRVIKEDTQKMVDDMFETGMNRLSIGDEKGAQESFNDATFLGMGIQPSQLPPLKSQAGKTK